MAGLHESADLEWGALRMALGRTHYLDDGPPLEAPERAAQAVATHLPHRKPDKVYAAAVAEREQRQLGNMRSVLAKQHSRLVDVFRSWGLDEVRTLATPMRTLRDACGPWLSSVAAQHDHGFCGCCCGAAPNERRPRRLRRPSTTATARQPWPHRLTILLTPCCSIALSPPLAPTDFCAE